MRVIALEEHYDDPVVATANQSNWSIAGATSKLLDTGSRRIDDMDRAGIDVQVLSLVTPAVQRLERATAVTTAIEANNALCSVIRRRPDRFAAFAALPTADPAAAARELGRAVTSLGFKGAMIHGHTDGHFLDEEPFWPILEAAQRLSVPIYLHPTNPPQGVLDAYYRDMPLILSTSGWGWHADTGLHAMRMIVAGVFDRFPGLQIVLGHMGEQVPYMLARANERLTPVCQHLTRTVAETFLEHFHLTTSGFHTDAPLQCALAVVGIDRLMFSVDYPFSSNQVATEWLARAPLSDADKESLAHRNAERLLGL